MSEYERVHFEKWQDLAKAVIDGSEIYFKILDYGYYKISFDGKCFNCDICRVFRTWGTYIKKQPTLAELIAIKPRLCRVHPSASVKLIVAVVDGVYYDDFGHGHTEVELLTDEEIKQFLNGE